MDRDLIAILRDHDELATLDPASRRLALRDLLAAERPGRDHARSLGELSDWIDGFGPLTRLMEDPDVSDVLVNGVDSVWVERSGRLERAEAAFANVEELMDLTERLLGSAGGRADAACPIGDVRLRDGSRLHVVLPPLAPTGPLLSIRRAPQRPYSLPDLVELRLLSPDQAHLLQSAVRARRTIVIGGCTGVGKTTLANALLGCVPPEERVVVIEETPELRPECAHWISLVARPVNHEGGGAIDQAALLRAALRMRPDRIVVGEVRGAEVSVALQAMATGHEGSLLTVHARAACEIPERLVDLGLMTPGVPESVLRRQVARSVDVVVQLDRSEGRRSIVEIVELDRDD